MKLTKPLAGIIPPMVTPLQDRDQLDTEGLNRLIEHMISGGVHGLFILGTTGEAPSLNYDLRIEMIERTCEQVAGRVPVLVGITDTSLSESLRLAEKAAESKADAVVCAPPYYFTPTQSELANYFRAVADGSPLPLYLYNMPSHTKAVIEVETVKELAGHENINGLKDSSANMIYFQKVAWQLRDRPEFSILVGPEEILMQTMMSGGHGGVNGGANMFPELYVDLYNACLVKDFDRIRPLQDRILEISSALYTIGNSNSSYLMGVKGVLSLMGICKAGMADPLHRFSAEESRILEERLKGLGVYEGIGN